MNKYIVLVLGLNIRAQNRITMEEQHLALQAVGGDLDARLVSDKGSYLVTSRHTGQRVVELVLGALRAYRPDLNIRGAALAEPAVVAESLVSLANVLTSTYGGDFDSEDYGIKLDADIWRAGLAMPLFPAELPAPRLVFHKTANAMIFGWTPGGVLVAKREAPNVHWETTVTDPALRLPRREGGAVLELSSRSANIIRDLAG